MPNNLTSVMPALLAQGLQALRGTDSMANLVNSDYNAEFKNRGDSVKIPIPSAVEVQEVTPSNVPPDTADVDPTNANLVLDNWFESPFYLTDFDMQKAMQGFIPMQATSAIGKLADKINETILANYKYVYGFVGTAGVTPFSSNVTAATNALTVLNNQLVPQSDRRMVLSPSAQGNALGLQHFNDLTWGANLTNITAGKMTPRLGFTFAMDQQVPTQQTVATTGAVNGAGQIGNSLVVDTLDALPLVGDIITIAGDTQTYSIVALGTMTQATTYSGTVTVSPQIKVAPADDAVITFKGAHTVNLAFHRDAIAFASRPLADISGVGKVITMTDPVSNISMRLEVTREHKRTRFSYDLLWGTTVVRPELACRVAG